MKFLVDNALSPMVTLGLRRLGYDAIHVRDHHRQESEDQEIMAWARREGRIVVTADTDFNALSALWNAVEPSIILFRTRKCRKPFQQLDVLQSNLPGLKKDLLSGAIVVFKDMRIRIRRLPIGGTDSQNSLQVNEPQAGYRVRKPKARTRKRK
jgi:predicted nuclease of predicted toxin-antitoxin system